MRIGIDIDDVLGGLMDQFILFHNETYDTNYKIGDFFSFAFWDVLGGTPEDSARLVDEFNNSKYFDNIVPVTGAVKAIDGLKKNHELIVITSRTNHIQEKTIKWLDKFFPEKFDEINFSNNAHRENGKLTKAEICKTENIDIMIEDCYSYIEHCSKVCKKVILFNRPWNQVKEDKIVPENIVRVNSWDEIIKEIGE